MMTKKWLSNKKKYYLYFFYFTVRTWLVLRTRLYRIHTNSEVYIIFPCLDTYHKPGPPTPTFLKTIPCLKSTCWPQLLTLSFKDLTTEVRIISCAIWKIWRRRGTGTLNRIRIFFFHANCYKYYWNIYFVSFSQTSFA